MDDRTFTSLELAHLYHQRWDCEMTYDEMKTHMIAVKQGVLDTDFRSKKSDGVLQEAYGILIAYNLVRGLMAEAAACRKISPLHISFVETLQVIESSIAYFEKANPENFSFLIRRLLDDIAANQMNRPRRKRSYPRKVRVKMSGYGRKDPSDKESKRDCESELRLVD